MKCRILTENTKREILKENTYPSIKDVSDLVQEVELVCFSDALNTFCEELSQEGAAFAKKFANSISLQGFYENDIMLEDVCFEVFRQIVLTLDEAFYVEIGSRSFEKDVLQKKLLRAEQQEFAEGVDAITFSKEPVSKIGKYAIRTILNKIETRTLRNAQEEARCRNR